MGSDCESQWKKMIGKPYSGKLNVRFDEGELEIEHRYYASSLLYLSLLSLTSIQWNLSAFGYFILGGITKGCPY
jgi:hypothetical protein